MKNETDKKINIFQIGLYFQNIVGNICLINHKSFFFLFLNIQLLSTSFCFLLFLMCANECQIRHALPTMQS